MKEGQPSSSFATTLTPPRRVESVHAFQLAVCSTTKSNKAETICTVQYYVGKKLKVAREPEKSSLS